MSAGFEKAEHSYDEQPPQPGRNGYVVLHGLGPDQYIVVRKCPHCGKDARVKVEGRALYAWEHGDLVQVAFPEIDADEREMLVTGIHLDCWEPYLLGREYVEPETAEQRNAEAANKEHSDGRHVGGSIQDRTFWAGLGCTECTSDLEGSGA